MPTAQDAPASPAELEAERWVWDEVLAGRVADLHARCNERLDPSDAADSRWIDERRKISAAFIERVLTQKPWRDALPHQGLRIDGARVAEPLSLFAARVTAVVGLRASRLESAVDLSCARFDSLVTFEGSVFEAGVNGNSLNVDGHLNLRGGAVRGGSLGLTAAKVGGTLDMQDSAFEAGVRADTLNVDGHLILGGRAAVRGAALNLANVKVGGTLHMQGSTFEAGVHADALNVSGDLILGGGAAVRGGALNLANAKVGGTLRMQGAAFEVGLNADSLNVSGHFVLIGGAAEHCGFLNLSGEKVGGNLAVQGYTFKAAVNAANLSVGGNLAMQAATFEAGVNAANLSTGGNLLLHTNVAVRGGPLELMGAKVVGNLAMQGSVFEAGVLAAGLSVGRRLVLSSGAAVRGGLLDLAGAKVGGSLEMQGSTFEAGVRADGLSVADHLVLRGGAAVRGGALDLAGAKVGGNLVMQGSTFETGIRAYGLNVGGNLVVRGATFEEAPEIRNSRIGGGLDCSEAALPGLNLSGTTVGGEIRLSSSEHGPPRWAVEARFVLRNVRAGALQDSGGSWPPGAGSLDLHGFTYGQLGGAIGGGEDAAYARPIAWYAGWLARDPAFARQPYQQLASVFRTAGYPDRAEEVLYAARERERAEAWKKGQPLRAAGLWLLKVTIGYGLTARFPRRMLLWVLALTALGAAVLSFPPASQAHGLSWRVLASFDQLLPIVELNKEFSEFFNDPKRERLARGQLAYFSIHALLGFLLGSFVVAALAGLTQARRG